MVACVPRCLALVGLSVAAACTSSGFACQDDAQCTAGGVQGACEPTGGCSFEDSTCPSGRRYGEHAPAGLGGACVVDPPDSDDASDASASSSASAGPTTQASTTGDTAVSASDDASATVAVSATEGDTTPSDTMGDDEGSTTSDSTTGDPPGVFFDAFDRPDGPNIGNGWIEKTPNAWRILDEQVTFHTVNGLDFRNNLVHRPLAEAMRDVEISAVLNFYTDEPFGYPQLHVRVQAGDVATLDSLTSYAVYVDSNDASAPYLTVNRIDGPGFGPYESSPIVPPPIDDAMYRLGARVTGTNPVVVEGWIEQFVAPRWQVLVSVTLEDASPQRLTEPGTVGMSGHVELQHFQFDEFSYEALDR